MKEIKVTKEVKRREEVKMKRRKEEGRRVDRMFRKNVSKYSDERSEGWM